MAAKRFRNKAWAYTVRRKSVLPKSIHLTFKNEEEGDVYVAHLEKLLDKGIVPPEMGADEERGGQRVPISQCFDGG